MQALPQRYTATATGGPEGPVPVGTEARPTIETGLAVATGDSGERWSPEELLMGAAADSLVLAFRAVAAEAELDWRHLSCEVEGVVDEPSADEPTRFSEVHVQAEVVVPTEGERVAAAQCLDRAEQCCLVTNSLSALVQLHHQIAVSAD